MYPSDPISPRMYGVVKAHTPEKHYPMRMILYTLGTANYGLSEYLVNIIQPTLEKNPTRLPNSRTFVQIARDWTPTATETQVSYDVINMYPSVPINAAIYALITTLHERYMIW